MPRAGHAQPKPAPRGRSAAAKAKAVAQAKLAAKNAKRSSRRTAVAALNTLAADVGAARAALAPKDATSDAVKLLAMRLQPRCHDGDLFERLRAATQLYVDGGGQLELEPAPDLGTAPHVQRHRVLKPEFRLHSSAFMLTYNSPSLKVGDWPALRSFIVALKGKMAARAWAACLEQSLHASDETINRHHCHAYFMWTDGVGICRESLADFVFRGPQGADVARDSRGVADPKTGGNHTGPGVGGNPGAVRRAAEGRCCLRQRALCRCSVVQSVACACAEAAGKTGRSLVALNCVPRKESMSSNAFGLRVPCSGCLQKRCVRCFLGDPGGIRWGSGGDP